MQYDISFSGKKVSYYTKAAFADVNNIIRTEESIIITDSNVARLYGDSFKSYKAVIEIPAGEEYKTFDTIQYILMQLLQTEAHRKTTIIGIGGGMVTDIAGFAASIYMRGIPFGFVPTTLLGMVDASIGGKNGINFMLQKNFAGTISQPEFILFDTSFLNTLPDEEWSNGFAEIIKYACLFDRELFETLKENNLEYYKSNPEELNNVIEKCIAFKNKIVQKDEHEHGTRKLLNFGHTAGHAIETIKEISHGRAVALGMLIACKLSEQYGLNTSIYSQVKELLHQYDLPDSVQGDASSIMKVLSMDKKRNNDTISFVLLKDIGEAYIHDTDINTIRETIESFIHAGNHQSG